jgi:hypothetical protein
MEYLRSKQTKHGWDILLMNGDKARKLGSFATMREADEYARGLMIEAKEKTHYAIPKEKREEHDTHS